MGIAHFFSASGYFSNFLSANGTFQLIPSRKSERGTGVLQKKGVNRLIPLTKWNNIDKNRRRREKKEAKKTIFSQSHSTAQVQYSRWVSRSIGRNASR